MADLPPVQLSTLGGVIKTAYETAAPVASQAEAEAGALTVVKSWTPQRVRQAAAASAVMIAVTGENENLAIETAKVTFRMPHGMTLTGVRASLKTASVGATVVVDINEGGASILGLGTKLSIDAGEKTSTTAASAATITDSALADDAEITIDIDQVGSTTPGAGLKVTLLGNRT